MRTCSSGGGPCLVFGMHALNTPIIHHHAKKLIQLSVDKNAGEQQQQQLLYHALEPDARQRQRVFELLMGVLVRAALDLSFA